MGKAASSRRKDAAGRARIGTLLTDADRDVEWVHEHARGDYAIRMVIPAERERPSERPLAGKRRRRMRRAWIGRSKASGGRQGRSTRWTSGAWAQPRGAGPWEPVPRDHPPDNHT